MKADLVKLEISKSLYASVAEERERSTISAA
jgi:hypothetical protein